MQCMSYKRECPLCRQPVTAPYEFDINQDVLKEILKKVDPDVWAKRNMESTDQLSQKQ